MSLPPISLRPGRLYTVTPQWVAQEADVTTARHAQRDISEVITMETSLVPPLDASCAVTASRCHVRSHAQVALDGSNWTTGGWKNFQVVLVQTHLRRLASCFRIMCLSSHFFCCHNPCHLTFVYCSIINSLVTSLTLTPNVVSFFCYFLFYSYYNFHCMFQVLRLKEIQRFDFLSVKSWIKFPFKQPYCIESRQSDMNWFEEGGDE